MNNSKQMSARARIEALLDDNSFVEIGALVSARNTDFNMMKTEAPSDGVITGYGTVDDSLVYVYSQDSAVLGGSVGEMHAKKIAKIYELALKVGAPVVGMIDCSGMRLQEATDALDAFGELYRVQTMASGVIPQLTAVFGMCGGGAALIPAMTDFTLMSADGRLFVNTPNALEGNYVEKCDTAKASYQAESGLVDVLADDDAQVIVKLRQLLTMLPLNNEDSAVYDVSEDDLNRENTALDGVLDTAYILQDIADDHMFYELKPMYAKEMVTGFLKLNGQTVGAVANRSEFLDENGEVSAREDALLSTAGARKAAQFVKFCDAFNIPVLTLVNVEGYKATKHEERTIAKACASLTCAFADATVPKVTVIVGKAYGSAYLAMNSRHIGADLVYAYPKAQIGMMDAKGAASIIYADELKEAKDAQALLEEKTAAYEALQTSPVSAAKHGYVDSIIEPAATRKRVIAAFEMLYTKREDRPVKKHGTI